MVSSLSEFLPYLINCNSNMNPLVAFFLLKGVEEENHTEFIDTSLPPFSQPGPDSLRTVSVWDPSYQVFPPSPLVLRGPTYTWWEDSLPTCALSSLYFTAISTNNSLVGWALFWYLLSERLQICILQINKI